MKTAGEANGAAKTARLEGAFTPVSPIEDGLGGEQRPPQLNWGLDRRGVIDSSHPSDTAMRTKEERTIPQ
jgi:hypothetical protein